ncbi:MAG: T9SS type A sorting domain-containing protein [Crocinitomicaceae bacterium]|nr:T9SS type A sorting domain-containing protein [Crocinitomicaceae bacterium]
MLEINQTEGKIVITDVSGRIVAQFQITGNSFRNIVSLGNAKGIYIYNILIQDASEYRGKIVVQ